MLRVTVILLIKKTDSHKEKIHEKGQLSYKKIHLRKLKISAPAFCSEAQLQSIDFIIKLKAKG